MPSALFVTEKLNKPGLCHAMCCQWVNQSRKLGSVNRLEDLGSPLAMFMNQNLSLKQTGNTFKNHEFYHLGLELSEDNAFRDLDGKELAKRCAQIKGYRLFLLYSSKDLLDLGSDGHMVAIRVEGKILQYFDPNIGNIQFENIVDMSNFLAGNEYGPYMYYPQYKSRLLIEI